RPGVPPPRPARGVGLGRRGPQARPRPRPAIGDAEERLRGCPPRGGRGARRRRGDRRPDRPRDRRRRPRARPGARRPRRRDRRQRRRPAARADRARAAPDLAVSAAPGRFGSRGRGRPARRGRDCARRRPGVAVHSDANRHDGRRGEMRPPRTLLGAAAVLAVAVAAACGGGGSSSGASSGGSHSPVTLTVWHQYAQEEAKPFQDGIARFEKQYPWIHVKLELQPNPDQDTFDPNLIAAIKGGNAPDVAIDFAPSYAGQYCSSGLWEDLTPFMQKDHMSISDFAPATQSYTNIDGKQCALP